MPDEEYFDYLDRVSGLNYQISEMGLGKGTTEFIELGYVTEEPDFVRNEGDFKEKLNRAGRRAQKRAQR